MVRIGGVAIAISLIAAAACSYSMNGWSDFDLLLVSALPVFSVGLAEDLGYLCKTTSKAVYAAVSGAAFIVLMGEWIAQSGIPGLDFIPQSSLFAIAF